jgi:hypothetical protein
MRRITGETGIRCGDRGGDDWNKEPYTDEKGQKRIRMTR